MVEYELLGVRNRRDGDAQRTATHQGANSPSRENEV